MPTNKPNNMGEYISGFALDVQTVLEKIRSTIKDTISDAEESISYGMPTFTLKGKTLVHFAAHKNHIGLYPVPTDSTFEQEFSTYKTSGKGTIQFPLNKPVPQELIAKIITFRAEKIRSADE